MAAKIYDFPRDPSRMEPVPVEGSPYSANVIFHVGARGVFHGTAEVHVRPPFTGSDLFFESLEVEPVKVAHMVNTVSATVLELYATQEDGPYIEEWPLPDPTPAWQADIKAQIVQTTSRLIATLNSYEQ